MTHGSLSSFYSIIFQLSFLLDRPALPKHDGNPLRTEITKSINEANENSVKERATLDGKSFRVIPGPISTGVSASHSKTKK